MKTIIILGDKVKQIAFTPETENEKKALKMITADDDIHTVIKRGTLYDRDEQVLGVDVYECQGGYMRAKDDAESVLFVLTPKKREESKIDHSIDVRYEPDVIKAFDKFIEKWCGENASHLLDTDEQDGQFMREKIQEAFMVHA